jgi:hypothetical protein
MLNKIYSTLNWLPYYYSREIRRRISGEHRIKPKHVYFCICDHFEPYWNNADSTTARRRVQRWLDEYPRIADRYLDSDGNRLKYSFFYPEEEYRKEDLDAVASLCHAGYGEVEIHLHHDNDTSENLRRTLLDYKMRLHEQHGLLSVDQRTGSVVYGFIHGNWALCNSRRDGRWCGVNDEIAVLQETGCYADFTMPSCPSDTQTKKVNSIYFASNVPGKPKSHDWGTDAEVGKRNDGLLMVQGPTAPDWGRSKYGVIPRIENSGLLPNFPPSLSRMKMWIGAGISVKGAPEAAFVKLYTHGTQENVMTMLFEHDCLGKMLSSLQAFASEQGVSVHFVSAREMVDVIRNLIAVQ